MILWVELVKVLATKGVVTSLFSRKILHILTGPIFMITWPWFGDSVIAARFAACVPLCMTFKFFLIGIGVVPDEGSVALACRKGDRKELLKGPLCYGIVFTVTTWIFWKQLTGVIALLCLCFGDGFAEIVGRKFGSNNKLFWNKRKSLAGFVGFVTAAVFFSWIFISRNGFIICRDDFIHENLNGVLLLKQLFFTNSVAGIIETLDIEYFDNVTVIIASIVANYFWKMKIVVHI